MKWLITFVFSSFTLLAWSGPNLPPEGSEVIVYEDSLYRGETLTLKPGAYTLAQLGANWNDRVSSIYVPDERVVLLFEHDNFQGRFLLLSKQNPAMGVRDSGSVGNFTNQVFKSRNSDKDGLYPMNQIPPELQWNDRTSSIIVYANQASIPRVVLRLTEQPQIGTGRTPDYCIPRYNGDNCYDPIRQIGNGFKNVNLMPYPLDQAKALPRNDPSAADKRFAGEQTPPSKRLVWYGSETDVDIYANGFELNVPDITVYRTLAFLTMASTTSTSEIGEMTPPRMTDFNDKLHGFNLCKGCVMTIYSDINYKGYSKTFNQAGEWDMWKQKFRVGLQQSNWGHRMSSFKLTFPKP